MEGPVVGHPARLVCCAMGAERPPGRTVMLFRSAIGLLLTLFLPVAAWAGDGGTYPDWKGQWRSIQRGGGNPPFDPSKPPGRGQGPPLTPEYPALFEARRAHPPARGPGQP